MQELADIAESLTEMGYIVMCAGNTLAARSHDKKAVFTVHGVSKGGINLHLAVDPPEVVNDMREALHAAGIDIVMQGRVES